MPANATSPALPSLQFPLGDSRPQPGATQIVRPGLHWIRMPLPFALDHINLWAFEEEVAGHAAWVAVDAGIFEPAVHEAWRQVVAGPLAHRRLSRMVVTHMHPDHIGNAQWLIANFSAPEEPARLHMSATDWLAARLGSLQTTGYGGERAADHFGAHGLVDEASQSKIRARGDYYASMVPQVPASYRRLRHGDLLELGGTRWRCLAGYGHAPEHISLYGAEAGILISGDMLLPRISTNISVMDGEPEADPLKAFLDSLTEFEHLPEDTLVLPSHGLPFTGIHERVRQLRDHHEDRLDDLRQACQTRPVCAAEVLGLLFKRTLDLHQTTFAMGEAIAHLNHLWHRGELSRERGADGVWRYGIRSL